MRNPVRPFEPAPPSPPIAEGSIRDRAIKAMWDRGGPAQTFWLKHYGRRGRAPPAVIASDADGLFELSD
jgi:hypothetical protein